MGEKGNSSRPYDIYSFPHPTQSVTDPFLDIKKIFDSGKVCGEDSPFRESLLPTEIFFELILTLVGPDWSVVQPLLLTAKPVAKRVIETFHYFRVCESEAYNPSKCCAPKTLRLFDISVLEICDWSLSDKKRLNLEAARATQILIKNVKGPENLKLRTPAVIALDPKSEAARSFKVSLFDCGLVGSLSWLPAGLSSLEIHSGRLPYWTKQERRDLHQKLLGLVSLKLAGVSLNSENVVHLLTLPKLEKFSRTGSDTRWNANTLFAISECHSLTELEVEGWGPGCQCYLAARSIEVREVVSSSGDGRM